MSLIDLASLVLAPTATKEGKVYSAIPDTGDGDMTFTRGSAATRVNSAGLIEKERGNLLLQSNTFNTTWSVIRSSVTSGASDPFGGSNAWSFLTDTTADDQHYIYQVISQSGVGTLSIYAKANGYNWLRLRLPSEEAFFDLANGVTGSSTTGISASITDVGSGWYRCEVAISDMSSNPNVFIHIAEGDGDVVINGTPSGTDGLYIYAAQLNQGLVAQSYIETTTSAVYEGITDDVPRVDYSGGGCPSLLLEGQRTNLYTYSEYSAIWNKTNWTTTDNYAISPEGVKNAFRAVSLNTSGILYLSGSGTTGQDNTLSVWAKSNTGGEQKFRFWGNGNTITSSDFTATTEWQRFDYTYNCAFVTAGIKGASSELSDILFYGFQHEAGSYPTSYIPTYGTSTSRVADSCSKTGISELIGQTEGTMFLDFVLDSVDGGNDFRFDITQGTSFDNEIFIGMTNGDLRALIRVSASNVYDSGNISSTVGTRYKMAMAYANNDVALYINGTQEDTSSSATIPNTDEITIGNRTDSKAMVVKESLNQAILFPTRLTNDQLEELTK